MERAAAWADLPFFEVIPRGLERQFAPSRLEAIGEVRMLSLPIYDRVVAFCAPDFFGLLRVAERRWQEPGLRERVCLIPEGALRDYMAKAAASALTISARQNLSRVWPFAAAQLDLTFTARFSFVGGILLLVVLVLLAPFWGQMWLLPLAAFVLLGPTVIRLGALAAPVERPRPARRPDDADLPVYSVLIPLRDEASMVPQLFAAMRDLDYPPERLDIKFVVETHSPETIAAVERELGDPRFSLVRVVDAAPRTKPKALGYALPLCRGEYVVVYDAEDIPDRDQLWKAAARFRAEPDIHCLQARLEIDNGDENRLAALFAGEYAGLFSVLVPALAAWRLPIPLGGTSNHFPLQTLRAMGGWDAFNVTEDADLGVRLARLRLRVEMLDSATHESGPTRFDTWIGQRTRWMKGWMQTFIVHNRKPRALLADLGWRCLVGFEVLVLGQIVAPLLHLGFMIALATAALTGHLRLDVPDIWAIVYGAVLLMGYGTTFLMTLLGLRRRQRMRWWGAQLFLPIYWLLMAVATVRAALELIHQPFYWFKSPHRPEGPVRAQREIVPKPGIRPMRDIIRLS
jgi:cellulose synthase/poly-beta-1,6-N-acetylglucosamine synthase-like glycosyltransferase